MAKCRITQTTTHDSPGPLVFLKPKWYQNVSYIGVLSPTQKFVVDIDLAEETTTKTEVVCSSMSVMATKTKAPDLGTKHKFETRTTRRLQ